MVGVFALGSAFSHLKVIKEYMKDNNLLFNEIANNIVFCLANCNNKNDGTRLLSLVRRDAIKWWYERYGDKLKAFQTFILPPRTGAIYKADNWNKLGVTTGEKHPEAEIRTFKNGEVKYLLREYRETEPKLIFMKLNKEKVINKIIK